MRKATITALTLAMAGCQDTGVHEDVSYDVRFGEATTMDLHVPSGNGVDRAAIMLIHGGAWFFGEKEMYTDEAERYAAAGYVAATINYRLVPTGTYPAAVQDCLCALSFIRANADLYGIDPDRIAVAGYSAGGQLSALLGVASDSPAHQPDCEWGPTGPPAAAIPGDGVYDFTKNNNSGWVADFLGGTLEQVPEAYEHASPLLNIKPGLPPFLVIHGHGDRIPIESAVALADELKAAGNSARMLEVNGAGHLSSPVTATGNRVLQTATDTPEAWAVTLDFLSHTLGEP